jgi:CRISPR system Cascade subunit CasC
MIVELHAIQNLAPSNINRDDLGAPKEAIFGGYRRARVSSQSWKKAMRDAFAQQELVPAERRAIRTKQLIDEVRNGLSRLGHDESAALGVAEALLQGIAIAKDPASTDENPKTEYLVFAGRDEIEALIKAAAEYWDQLAALAGTKGSKKELRGRIPEPIKEAASKALTGSQAADLALFGRMLADLPLRNVEAAVQVAHAISTHAVEFEQDFYTAVDDLNTREEPGAGMMGYVGFNSATLYRYANLDTNQLRRNLPSDDQLVLETIRAFAHAFVTSLPSGKQNSMATPAPPALVVAVVRDGARWSLVNAFANPVRVGRDDLVGKSIRELGAQWRALVKMYGDDDVHATPVLIDERYSVELGETFGAPSRGLSGWLDDLSLALRPDIEG